MAKIKYVGLKHDGETAFGRETGITWFQGDSHEVPDSVAKRMLNHPDVFAVDSGAVKAEPAPAPAPAPVTLQPVIQLQAQEPVTETKVGTEAANFTLAPGAEVASSNEQVAQVVDLALLDKEALHALAKERGIKVHHNAGADTVRKALAEAQQ